MKKRFQNKEFYQRVKSTNSHLNNIQQEHNIFKRHELFNKRDYNSEIKLNKYKITEIIQNKLSVYKK